MSIAYSEETRTSLASRKEVAEFLGIPVQTMAVWATRGDGPMYRKVGRHAKYSWDDVHAWLSVQATGGNAA